MKIEINGFTELVQLIDDGNFSNGMGNFATEGNIVVDADTQKSANITITNEGLKESAILKRDGLNLAANQGYDISFVAGAKQSRDIKAVLEDAAGQVIKEEDFTLTTDPTQYAMHVDTKDAVNGATLKFMLGGTADTVYMDTVRMDVTGYTQAAGINLSAHDITGLNKQNAPMISESVNAVIGEDITLTFPVNVNYQNAIDSITVNGTEVFGTAMCSVGNGEIVLDQSLFSVETGKDRGVADIVVKAAWYKDTVIKQVVFPSNMWSLTWKDEFDRNGSNLDPKNGLDLSKWSYQTGNGEAYNVAGWGNQELEYYSQDNIKVEDGILKIEARKEDKGGMNYTSGRIWTLQDDKKTPLFSQTYGRFEAKIKMPGTEGSQGLWPAFWMLPVDCEYGGWPLSGEIDIMEARGREPDRVDGTIHFGQPYPNNQALGDHYVWENNSGSINDYHVYSVEWQPGEIRWYVDGDLYYTENNWYSLAGENDVEFAYPAPFDQEFYIILNLAIGGTYDNLRIPDDSVIPAEMLVDYVRVYEYNGEYSEPVKPVLDKETIPAGAKVPNADGDYIVDPGFDSVRIIKDYETIQDPVGWNFATLPDFGGAATFTKVEEDGTTLGKIDISNSGNAAYSIQLIQNIPLVKGHYYKISFDAKAEKSRELSIKFGDVGDDGWGVYGSYSPILSKQLEHYEYTFQMGSKTDITSRIEFNLGLNSTNVWIGNVSFKEVDGKEVDTNCIKKPGDSGNHVYNGTFDLGDDRLAYWNVNKVDAKVVGNVLQMTTTADQQESVSQQGLELLQNDTYKLVFDGNSSVARDIQVMFSNVDGSIVYSKQDVTLDAGMTKRELTFQMPDITDNNAKMTFLVGGKASIVKIDNVVLTRETNRNVDFSDINCYPLQNGDFELGIAPWSGYGMTPSIVKEGDNKVCKATGAKDGESWNSMLQYEKLEITSGFTYIFSFKAKANKEADITMVIEDKDYNAFFPRTTFHVTKDWQTFYYESKFAIDGAPTLKYLLAGTGSELEFYIDDVVFEIKAAPKKSGTLTEVADLNYIGNNVEFTTTGEKAWMEGAEFFIDGNKVDATDITISDSTVTLSKNLFTEAREYVILVKSGEYANYRTTIRVYGNDKNLLLNGDFAYGLNSWATYSHQNCADFIVENGYLKIDSKFQALESNKPITWSIQLGQEKIPVVPGEEFILTFVGYSTVERKIVLEGMNNKTVTLTTTPQIHQVSFVADSFDLDLNLLLGTVDGTGDKEHEIYLGNFALYEKSDFKNPMKKNPGEQLDTPLQVFAEAATKGVRLQIVPALTTPSGVTYQIFVNDKLTAQTEETTYLFETTQTGNCRVEVRVVKEGYIDSTGKEITIQLRDTSAPDAPYNFKVKSTGKGEVTITITPPYDNVGVVGYLIYVDGEEYKNSTSAEVVLTGITEGEHLFNIRAYDAAGNISAMPAGEVVYVSGDGNNGNGNGNGSGNSNGNGSYISYDGSQQSSMNAIWSYALILIKQVKANVDAEVAKVLVENDAVVLQEILTAMKDKPVQLIIDMKEYSWSINGDSIKDGAMSASYNLEVGNLTEQETTKLQQIVDIAMQKNSVKISNIIKEFKIGHEGAFSFEGKLTMPLDTKYANTYVHIYYWNEKKDVLEVQDIVKVDKDGMITIPMSHASSYVITEQPILFPKASTSVTVYTSHKNTVVLDNVVANAVVSYQSSNKKVATVDSKGVITGKKAGSATITVIVIQGDNKYVQKSKVVVKTSVFKFNKKTAELKVGKSFTFTLTNNGYSKDVLWTVTDPSIAKISKNGKLTALKAGTVTVCATVEGKTIMQKVKIK
ncbi:carbohydrate binding domain-containing protein [Anaerosporobacter sp.]|uniref:carbohydrate binding domain-containing protein n=1 Tax=Anaerosporobacter sp. TaxID=1872529 RepID=UPI00286F3813|nr:carbohydrate binding domain-containing protein [Anaerosporobacter sp.]